MKFHVTLSEPAQIQNLSPACGLMTKSHKEFSGTEAEADFSDD
jgi:hypothetical protein